MEQRTAELRAEFQKGIAALEARLERRVSDLIKWMFLFWIGTVLPLAGLIVALGA